MDLVILVLYLGVESDKVLSVIE